MITKAEMDAYIEDLRRYWVRMAEWLGLDPSQVMRMDEEPKRVTDGPYDPPANLDITWQSFDRPHEADQGQYRYRLPMSMRGDVDGTTTFANGVSLAWPEADRLRFEVGEKPQMPAPPGGWDALKARLA